MLPLSFYYTLSLGFAGFIYAPAIVLKMYQAIPTSTDFQYSVYYVNNCYLILVSEVFDAQHSH